MKFSKSSKGDELKLNLSSMIDVTFLLIIYFIVSMQMEPSLDNIIKLPPILNADKQEDALLQIYVLPASIMPGGGINKDSTGLVAFSDKAKTPDNCPACGSVIKGEAGLYVPNSLLGTDGAGVPDLQKAMGHAYGENALPPAFRCAKCSREISPYLKLDEIPSVLKAKKKEVLEVMVRQRDMARKNSNPPVAPMSASEIERLEKDSLTLMIKADGRAFYGRILQVVNMAKDTLSDIRNFAFITNADFAKDVKAKKEKGR